MSVHYPPVNSPTFPISSGDVFTRWSPTWRRFLTLEVRVANQATEMCRVSLSLNNDHGFRKDLLMSMTDIRTRYTHGAGAPR